MPPKLCKSCGKVLGDLVAVNYRGASVTVLQVGGLNILNAEAICANCGCPVYHHIGLYRLLDLLRLTGRDVTEDELTKE